MPFLETNANPSGWVAPSHPPVPPQASGFGMQSTNSSSERIRGGLPVAIASADSTVSAVLNAQHEPQLPWFLTAETTPLVRQSTESGSLSTETSLAWCFWKVARSSAE